MRAGSIRCRRRQLRHRQFAEDAKVNRAKYPLKVAVTLIILHALNGDEVSVNPDSITSMRDRAPEHDADDRLMAKGVECMISLSDGKNVSVVEHCDKVRELIKEAK
jgi:uncharacterized protein YlzI (FlbEa/FlbD family)